MTLPPATPSLPPRSSPNASTSAEPPKVGPIGGVTQKVTGAARAGATVFLAPSADASDARQAAAGRHIQVIQVDTFAQAVTALKSLPPPAP